MLATLLLKNQNKLFYIFTIILLFAFYDICFPVKTQREYSTIIEAKDGTVLSTFLTNDDKWRLYTKLDEITPTLQKAFIEKEDKYFYWHFGINPVAVIRAFVNNTIKHRRTSGASTITMQVARMLQPKERTVFSKIREMLCALQLEWNFSKKEILQLYLNLVPYGSNVEGVKSASFIYFGKAPSQLSLAEVTVLTIIPNRPTSLRLGKNNAYITEERNKWLKRFKKDKVFKDEIINDALEEPLLAYRRDAPKFAPHFSLRLKRANPNIPILATNINYNMQLETEELVGNYARILQNKSINNCAVMIVDNQQHELVAYIGSPDFYNSSIKGQVDGVRAIRSPGSTLKPLIYGISFDKGIYTPRSVITDVPINFDGYSPENYDQHFHGKIALSDALSQSFNVPAVKVLHDIGVNTMVNYLDALDFKQIQKDKSKLGLSLALGGCGVSLEEMTNLYSSFANNGKYTPPKMLQKQRDKNPIDILSPEANYMVAQILTQLRRSDLPNNAENVVNLPKIAWKTGTSYGRRDAWSIGFNNQYTVGVWCGNFDGTGVPDLNGADIATPLLLQIFNTISKNTAQDWFKRPKGLQFRWVCAETGNLPEHYCKNKLMALYIPGKSPNKKCEHLKKVWVNADSTMSYCSACLPPDNYVEKYYPNYPPELLQYYENSNLPFQKIPKHNLLCSRIQQSQEPKIYSPTNGMVYYLNKQEKQQMQLSCQAAIDVEKISWYVNNQFIQTTVKSTPVFIHPPLGKVKISCTDDKGRNTDIWVEVKEM
ncbi:MAG TPA: penicillin-binding protein 1C [Chitinophagales bacterium]|nr:penicillin-binding protein 1C [Chitinophagales bacterium]